MISVCSNVIPKQPFLLFATEYYEKIEVMKYGISHFYAFNANGVAWELAEVVPDGCIDIMFISSSGGSKAVCIGTPLGSKNLGECHYFEKDDKIFGVRFLPGNMLWMKRCRGNELLDASLDFGEVSGENCMISEIFEAKNFRDKISVFLKHYMSEYENNYMVKTDSPVFYMLRSMIETKGTVRISDLASEMAFSVRYVNEMFRNFCGLSPKEFEKLLRFQNILLQLDSYKKITDAAMEAGYYDQSHMLKEFRSLTGVTPRQYLKKREFMEFENKLHIKKYTFEKERIS